MTDPISLRTLSPAPPSGSSQQLTFSANVKEAQTLLNAHTGEQLKPDGLAGDKTTEALRRFQDEQGLRITGKADVDTLAKLRELATAAQATQERNTSSFERTGTPREPVDLTPDEQQVRSQAPSIPAHRLAAMQGPPKAEGPDRFDKVLEGLDSMLKTLERAEDPQSKALKESVSQLVSLVKGCKEGKLGATDFSETSKALSKTTAAFLEWSAERMEGADSAQTLAGAAVLEKAGSVLGLPGAVKGTWENFQSAVTGKDPDGKTLDTWDRAKAAANLTVNLKDLAEGLGVGAEGLQSLLTKRLPQVAEKLGTVAGWLEKAAGAMGYAGPALIAIDLTRIQAEWAMKNVYKFQQEFSTSAFSEHVGGELRLRRELEQMPLTLESARWDVDALWSRTFNKGGLGMNNGGTTAQMEWQAVLNREFAPGTENGDRYAEYLGMLKKDPYAQNPKTQGAALAIAERLRALGLKYLETHGQLAGIDR